MVESDLHISKFTLYEDKIEQVRLGRMLWLTKHKMAGAWEASMAVEMDRAWV